jgi:hypothetical protein
MLCDYLDSANQRTWRRFVQRDMAGVSVPRRAKRDDSKSPLVRGEARTYRASVNGSRC